MIANPKFHLCERRLCVREPAGDEKAELSLFVGIEGLEVGEPSAKDACQVLVLRESQELLLG